MAESWAGGLERGLLKGLQIGSMFEEGKARKAKSKASTRMEERKKYMDQINISTSFFNNKAAHNDAKLEEYRGPYSDAVKKITGKKPVPLTSWGPNIPEYTKRLNNILRDDSLTRKQKFVSARALEAEAKGDPQVAGMVSVGIEEEKREEKLAHEKNKRLATQLIVEFKHNKAKVEPGSVEAKALATDFYNKLKKIKDIDPRAVGAATEELKIILSREGEEATTIPYEKEKPLTGTGYKTTTTGVRVMDTNVGRVALIGGKQVLYDESIHGQLLEKPLTIAQRKSEWAEMRAEELRGEGTWSEREITGKVLTELNQKFPSKTGTDVTVNLGTSTKTKIEQDIIEGDFKIESFNEIEKLFKDDYLTYKGQTQAAYEKYAEKLGIPVDTDYLANRTQWKQEAMTTFLAWRKWVTGVAGGEKEMREIAKSFPDPQRNSPTEFRANLKQARKTTIKLRNRLIMFRSIGIENPTKEQLSKYPIEHVPDVLAGDEGDSRGSGVTVDINTADSFLEKYGGGR